MPTINEASVDNTSGFELSTEKVKVFIRFSLKPVPVDSMFRHQIAKIGVSEAIAHTFSMMRGKPKSRKIKFLGRILCKKL